MTCDRYSLGKMSVLIFNSIRITVLLSHLAWQAPVGWQHVSLGAQWERSSQEALSQLDAQ